MIHALRHHWRGRPLTTRRRSACPSGERLRPVVNRTGSWWPRDRRLHVMSPESSAQSSLIERHRDEIIDLVLRHRGVLDRGVRFGGTRRSDKRKRHRFPCRVRSVRSTGSHRSRGRVERTSRSGSVDVTSAATLRARDLRDSRRRHRIVSRSDAPRLAAWWMGIDEIAIVGECGRRAVEDDVVLRRAGERWLEIIGDVQVGVASTHRRPSGDAGVG